ncbi:DinB family protein [Granulicella sp. dw_53]|uniref:DinB family protein n=1 Tax=Granulicella sp. dw_53 TaxID=2719792 RepID=UPI001BD4864E|nr:DinB family protein [Granulicella sp. dw_53]
MLRMKVGCSLAGLIVSSMALAQAPAGPPPVPGPAGEVQRSYAAQKDNILKSAEKMPADQYQYKATPEVRTFARVVNHVTEAQFRSCGIANGTAPSAIMKPPSDTADKAAIIEGLKASFAECDKAYGATTDANFVELLTAGQGKRSRAGLLWGNVSHDNEQYSALSMYLRLKGIAPPTSEK